MLLVGNSEAAQGQHQVDEGCCCGKGLTSSIMVYFASGPSKNRDGSVVLAMPPVGGGGGVMVGSSCGGALWLLFGGGVP